MMRPALPRCALVFALAFIPLAALAQNPARDWIHETVLRGIDELYNLEFDSALTTFDSVIDQAPSDPRGYFFKGMVHFWIFNLNRDKIQFEKLEDLFEATIERAEAMLDRDEKSAAAAFYLGGAYGFRGLAHQRNGSLWSAVWDGRKGYSYLEEAIELDPMLYDAHMGFGLFRYMVAKIPASFRWILSLLGFSGDVQGGIESLRLAAERGTYTRAEASFFLAQFLFFEERPDEALTYFEPLLRRYPENSIFQLAYAGWQYQLENIDAAKTSVNKAIEINARRNIRFGDELAYNMRYQISFIESDFASAKENILTSMEKSENKENISGWATYRLGLCYEFLGARDSAIVAYRKVKKVDDDERAYDTYAYRKAQERLRSPVSDVQKSLILAGNLHSARRYNEAITAYTRVMSMSKNDPDDGAEALYGLMRALYEIKDDDGVIHASRRLEDLEPKRERWCIPHAYWKLGQAYARKGLTEQARTALEEVGEYDDYDFRISLEDRVDRLLSSLDKD